MTIQQADELIETLATREAQLAAMAAQVGARLAEVEAQAGDSFLDGDEHPMREVVDLRLQADTLTAALAALERRKEPARLARRRAEAADFRRQAEEKRSELTRLEQQTSRLLAELGKLEGFHTASILASQPVGSWLDIGYEPNRRLHLAAHELARDIGATYATPRSRTLRAEIEELEAKAIAIEREINPPAPEPSSGLPRSIPSKKSRLQLRAGLVTAGIEHDVIRRHPGSGALRPQSRHSVGGADGGKHPVYGTR